MSKKYWKDSFAYENLQDILDTYWLEEPDELAVHIELEFLKANGERQTKTVRWHNPNYVPIKPISRDLHLISLADVEEVDPRELYKIKINPANYRKKENE